MFTIQLYKNNSEKNKIGKELEATQSFTGNLKEETSIVHPRIVVQSPGIPLGNYAYIEAFNRYYFINNITSVINGLWELALECDVLETYQSEIKKCDAIITRQEFTYNLYLADDKLSSYIDRFTIDKKFGSGIFSDNNNSNILMISGFISD